MEDKKQEEKPLDPAAHYDVLNQCRRCGIRAGAYIKKDTQERIGVYLLVDARGFKICNLCASEGYLVKKTKMNKSEKRKFKKMRQEMNKVKDIKHVTLNAKGEVVE